MVCGILGFFTAGLSGIAAVILGHIGRSKIKKSNGALTGGGLAMAGLVTGYLSLLVLPFAALAGLVAPIILRQQEAANWTTTTSNMEDIGLCLMEFHQEFGAFPSDDTAASVAEATRTEAGKMKGAHVFKQVEAYGISGVQQLFAVSSRAEGEWIYFPNSASDPDPVAIVLVSPAIRGEAMALCMDRSMKTVGEPELSRLRASPGAVTIPAPRR